MIDHIIHTERLVLIASPLEHLEAELSSPALLGDLLGVAIPEDWPPGEYDRHALDFFHEKLKSEVPSPVGWYGWYAIMRDLCRQWEGLIGAAGYLGPPAKGSVEIGYSVLPSARGKGFAKEIVKALVAPLALPLSRPLLTTANGQSNL